jgi:dTDP-4-amino-4,6-dideoxygalactose transaminase
VFADIDRATLNLDPDDVAAKVTDRTKALMPVHLFGRVMPLEPLAGLGPPIVEDAAQAFGAEGVARFGVLSTFSFYPSKNLFAMGDAGLVTATDEELADRVSLLRFHGSREKRDFQAVGYNSRLDEMQAAVLRLFLEHIDEWNQSRREAAGRYEELGLGELCELPPDEPGHVYHMYVVRSPERDRLAEALAEAGIGHASYYVTPLHLQPALRYLGYEEGALPETERAARENLALPMWAGIPVEAQERIVSVIREAAAVRA